MTESILKILVEKEAPSLYLKDVDSSSPLYLIVMGISHNLFDV